MDRREFLRTTGAAAATAATAATAAATDAASPSAPAVGKGLKELRLAMPWADGVAGPAEQARRLAQRIAAMSGGRMRIAILPGVANGPGSVHAGEAELYFASGHDGLHLHRALAYFAGLPGDRGIAPRHLTAWMLVGGGQPLWDDLAGEFGLKGLLAGHTGERSLFLAARQLESMSELAGEKVAVTGLAADVVRGFGLEPTAIAASDTAAALARGDIVAAELGGAATSHALGITASAPYSAGASINRHGAALSLGMRRELWDRFAAADQEMLAAATAAELQLAVAEDGTYRRMLHPEPAPERRWPFARELARAVRRVSDAVVAQVATADAHARRINASYVAFRRAALGDGDPPGAANA